MKVFAKKEEVFPEKRGVFAEKKRLTKKAEKAALMSYT
jgi:hypothetical protein